MVAEPATPADNYNDRCSLAKISMVAELELKSLVLLLRCSLAKISMVAERPQSVRLMETRCSLAKISMVAEPQNI